MSFSSTGLDVIALNAFTESHTVPIKSPIAAVTRPIGQSTVYKTVPNVAVPAAAASAAVAVPVNPSAAAIDATTEPYSAIFKLLKLVINIGTTKPSVVSV